MNSHLHCWKERTKVRKVTKFKVDTSSEQTEQRYCSTLSRTFTDVRLAGGTNLSPVIQTTVKFGGQQITFKNWKSTNFKAFVLAVLTDFR